MRNIEIEITGNVEEFDREELILTKIKLICLEYGLKMEDNSYYSELCEES